MPLSIRFNLVARELAQPNLERYAVTLPVDLEVFMCSNSVQNLSKIAPSAAQL